MMWRCVDLVHSFVPLVFIATFWSVVYAQSETNGPCNTCPVECIGKQCARKWWSSMWGFIITFIALIMDIWGVTKSICESITNNVFVAIFISALNPLFVLWGMLNNTMDGMAMLANLHEKFENDVIAPLYPWSKSDIKIISGSAIIVNLSSDVYNEIHNFNAFDDDMSTEDFSEALVVGNKIAHSKQFNVELTKQGQLALLRSKVLPPYDELKFLRGNTSLGMAIASVQAIGYIYGIVVRCVQGLHVSPIEAIACILNLIILMKGVLHIFSNLGHRPLLLYLLPEEEAKFIEECKNIQSFVFKIGGRLKLVVSIACGVLLAVDGYFIYNFLKSLTKICVVPIILFEVSLVMGGIVGCLLEDYLDDKVQIWLSILVTLLNSVGYVWALVVTFKY